MIIKKVTIHNIASIADATIDFEAQPLDDAKVFLITGETGAGKTTLLDAICLALFNKTPRMELGMNSEETEKKVKANDTRQLLRRGADDGSVRLLFKGNDGVDYESEWQVHRSRKGKLQDIRWTWTNCQTPDVTSGKTAIRSMIDSVVGLSFDQFCRTTMLAQGEFTKFLNSTDNEKALILEKITDSSIYAKIAVRIHQHCAEAENELRRQEDQLKNITLLTEVEKTAFGQKLNQLAADVGSLEKQIEEATTKRKWLEDENVFEKELAVAQQRSAEAEQETKAEDFVSNVKLLADWDDSYEARDKWNECLQVSKKQVQLGKRLEKLHGDYALMINGKAFEEQRLENLSLKLHELKKLLETEADRGSVFENSAVIINQLREIVGVRKNISKEEETVARLQTSIGKHRKQVEKAKDDLETVKKQCTEKKKELDEQQDLFAKFGLSEKRKEKELLVEKKHLVEKTVDALGNEKTELERRKRMEKDLNSLRQQKKENEENSVRLESQIEKMTIIRDEAKKAFERMEEANDKDLEARRVRLVVGCTCPLCQQKVRQLPPQNEELRELMAEAQAYLAEAEANLEQAKTRQGRNQALLATINQEIKKKENELANDQALENAKTVADKLCRQVGETDAGKLVAMIESIGSNLKTKDTEIREGEKLEAKLSDIQKVFNRLQAAVNEKTIGLQKENNSLKDELSKWDTSKALIEEYGKSELANMRKVEMTLGKTQWDKDWKISPLEFIVELQTATQKHIANQKQAETWENNLQKADERMEQIGKSLEAIADTEPEWTDGVNAPMEVKDMGNKAQRLVVEVQTAEAQREELKKTLEEARKQLLAILRKKPNLTENRLEMLIQQAENIAALRADVQRKQAALTANKAKLESAYKRLEQHQKNRPQLEESEDTDGLQSLIAEKRSLVNGKNQEIGNIRKQLTDDQLNHEMFTEKIKQRDETQKLFDKWKSLKDLTGKADGSDFRKIAEAYVLGSLIRAANVHLRSLTDRYLLHVKPGTFLIMLEDYYQYRDMRPASTLSGGESFLVSLALALALSDIDNRYGVNMLFIDEGFGTLSDEPLDNAISTLRNLHTKLGRRVGIISHVDELKERINVQIRVDRKGHNAESTVSIVDIGKEDN